jgi:hypothetical protein
VPSVSLPNPRTWALGELIKAPYLRADVSDAVALLAQPPLFTGQQGSAQTITNATETEITIDTENYDNYGGHLASGSGVNTALYYGMFPGWYLVQAQAPLQYTGGAGTMGASVGVASGGGALTYYGGERIPNSGTASLYAFPVACKLAQMVDTGTYGGSGNDRVAASCYQDSGSSQALYAGTNRFPSVSARWVCALAGTPGLPVPPLAAWPTPPSYVTSAFMNAQVRDTIRFLVYPPICEYQYNAGTQSLASQASVPATGTTVKLDTAVVDNYSAFSTSTWTWTAPVAGLYWVYNLAAMSQQATATALMAGITVTSANYNGGATFTAWGGTRASFAGTRVQSAAIRRQLRLNAGDTLQAAAWQSDSGSNAATLAGNTNEWQSRFIVIWRNA